MRMIATQTKDARATRFANTAWGGNVLRRFLPALATAFAIAISPPVGAAQEGPEVHHRKTVDGMVVYLGVMPAEIVRGHLPEHAESKMHGGVPTGSSMQHIVIALFDGTSGERITDAKLKASVGQVGLGAESHALEPMPVAGAMTYGNYFPMPGSGIYRIHVEIERPRATHAASVDFEYRKDAN